MTPRSSFAPREDIRLRGGIRIVARFERLLWVTGVVSMAYLFVLGVQARAYRNLAAHLSSPRSPVVTQVGLPVVTQVGLPVVTQVGSPVFTQVGSPAVQSGAARPGPEPLNHSVTSSATGEVIGLIEIPALALSAPIAGDFDAGSLRKAVGHIPGTAMPGGLGTVGLAGHRDSFFRPLAGITPRMDVRLTSQAGTFHYIVDRTEIVTPDRVEVLAIARTPELTLITCFPFNYVGAAPRRFIVHAHLVSAQPDSDLAAHAAR